MRSLKPLAASSLSTPFITRRRYPTTDHLYRRVYRASSGQNQNLTTTNSTYAGYSDHRRVCRVI